MSDSPVQARAGDAPEGNDGPSSVDGAAHRADALGITGLGAGSHPLPDMRGATMQFAWPFPALPCVVLGGGPVQETWPAVAGVAENAQLYSFVSCALS